MNDILQVAFASDNNYAQHLAVSIASLLSNAGTPGPICISILHDGLAPDHQEKISQLTALRSQTEIRFITVEPDDFRDFPLHTKLHSIATYYRLKLPELLPDAAKVIYLDSDIVVKGDISDLWAEDLQQCVLKAVEEPHSLNHKRQDSFGMKADSPYFNGGVLLLNLALMRAQNFNRQAADFIGQYSPVLRYQDQDVLNALAEGNWSPLPLSFNSFFYVYLGIYARDFLHYSSRDIKMARTAPFIIHFNQHPKPWAAGCIDPRRAEYFRYIDLTAYKGFRVNQLKSLWPSCVKKFRATVLALSVKAPWLYLFMRGIKRGIRA